MLGEQQRYPVHVGPRLVGHRVLRGEQWFAHPLDGEELPARDGAHAGALVTGAAVVSARPGRMGRPRASSAAQGRPLVHDLAAPLRFVIEGAPRTKNTGKVCGARAGGKVVVVPPVPYRRWLSQALPQAERERARLGFHGCLCVAVRVTARFYLDQQRHADHDRLLIGLGDFLKATGRGAGFVTDDSLIRWAAPVVEVDRVHPRVEIEIAVASATTGSGSSSSSREITGERR